MKRFAVTGFAVLYAVLVFGISANRTAVWVEAASHKQPFDAATSIGKIKDTAPLHRNARILQNQFVVESPLIDSGVTLPVNRHLDDAVDAWSSGSSLLQIPSRAPPSLI